LAEDDGGEKNSHRWCRCQLDLEGVATPSGGDGGAIHRPGRRWEGTTMADDGRQMAADIGEAEARARAGESEVR
jgi:hypothetical protein